MSDWNYLCCDVDDAAERLLLEQNSLRRAFGQHLKLVAKALQEIERADAAGISSDDEVAAIKAVLGDEES